MPIVSSYVVIVSMDVDPDKEGGQEKKVALDGPSYSAICEIDSPQVLTSAEWAKSGNGPVVRFSLATDARSAVVPRVNAPCGVRGF